MPIYAYRCESCGHDMETLRRVSDPPLTDCPTCGKPTLVKKVTAAGFQLKGSGWYVTDFRNAGSKPAAADSGGKAQDSAAPSEAKPDAPAQGKSESKPEAKADSTASASSPAPATPTGSDKKAA